MGSREVGIFNVVGRAAPEVQAREAATNRIEELGDEMAQILLGHHITVTLLTKTNGYAGSASTFGWRTITLAQIAIPNTDKRNYDEATLFPATRRYDRMLNQRGDGRYPGASLGLQRAVRTGEITYSHFSLGKSRLYEPYHGFRTYSDRAKCSDIKTISGTVDGVDPEHLAIVVNREPMPRFFGRNDKGWIHLIKPDGTPLVEIKVDDQ